MQCGNFWQFKINSAFSVEAASHLAHLQEAARIAVGSREGEHVQRGEARMLARGHKEDGGRAIGHVVGERGVGGARHGLHARLQVGQVDALDVDLQWDRPHACAHDHPPFNKIHFASTAVSSV